MTRILMVAYAQFFNDARIKAYVHDWLESGAAVDVFCLHDPESGDVSLPQLRVRALQTKYQGQSAWRYVLSYAQFWIRAYRAVRRAIREAPYQVYHVHNMPDALVFCIPARRRRGGQLILDMHDVMLAAVLSKFHGIQRWVFYPLVWIQTWLSVRWADALIHADHSQMDLLAEYGIRHPRRMVYLNLPQSRWFRRRAPTPPHNPIRVVYHGSITERAGLDLAIEAIRAVNPRIPMTLTLIGDGEMRSRLETLCRQTGLLNQIVFFKDFMRVEDLQQELEQYDLGIVANRKSIMSARCMLPVKLMEYLRIGIPVIAPDLPVIRRYFTEAMVCYFEPDNVQDLARALETMASHPSRWPTMIRAADSFFEQYSEQRQSAAYRELALGGGVATPRASS